MKLGRFQRLLVDASIKEEKKKRKKEKRSKERKKIGKDSMDKL